MKRIRRSTKTEKVSNTVRDGKDVTTTTTENRIVTENVVNVKYDEKYISFRKTQGIWWITKFNSNELMMMIVLLHFEDFETHIIILDKCRREFLCRLFEVTRQQIYNIIKGLIEKHALLKVNSSKLILNPAYMYNGSVKLVRKRIDDFYDRYNSIYGTYLSFVSDIVYLPEELEDLLK
jgi:hypothetical protein